MKNVYFALINLGPHCHKHTILIGKQKGWIDVVTLDQLYNCYCSDESFSIKSSIQWEEEENPIPFTKAVRNNILVCNEGILKTSNIILNRSSELHMLGLEKLVKGRFPEYFYKPKVRPIIANGIILGWSIALSASL